MDFAKLIEMDRAAVLHPFTNLKDFNQGKMDPTFITGGKGIYLENHKGEKILDAFSHGYTYSGHPLAAATALKVLSIVEAEKMIARGMPHGDILGISPPLILTKDEADIIVKRVGIAVDNVTDNLVKQGVKLG